MGYKFLENSSLMSCKLLNIFEKSWFLLNNL